MNPGPEPLQQDPAAAPVETDAAAGSERPHGGPSWPLLGGVALVVMLLVRGFLVQSFYVPSGSMEPTIEPGDRILVNKLADGDSVRRGDVVVFDGTTSFAVADRTPHQDAGAIGKALAGAASLVGINLGEQDFVKRVIGLPGDHVVCCDAQGRLTVNGKALTERYLYPGDAASTQKFDVTVPEGRLWLLGDHRSVSADSRSLLGAPGGGMVRADRVIGRPVQILWPLDRFASVARPPLAVNTTT